MYGDAMLVFEPTFKGFLLLFRNTVDQDALSNLLCCSLLLTEYYTTPEVIEAFSYKPGSCWPTAEGLTLVVMAVYHASTTRHICNFL